ncbi:MAG: hypothetical protein ACQER9_04420 [Nanobdellota archaeon]
MRLIKIAQNIPDSNKILEESKKALVHPSVPVTELFENGIIVFVKKSPFNREPVNFKVYSDNNAFYLKPEADCFYMDRILPRNAKFNVVLSELENELLSVTFSNDQKSFRTLIGKINNEDKNFLGSAYYQANNEGENYVFMPSDFSYYENNDILEFPVYNCFN